MLAVGAAGDLVCWPLEGIAFAGALTDPVEAWLRCGPVAARHTVVAGRAVVRDGELVAAGRRGRPRPPRRASPRRCRAWTSPRGPTSGGRPATGGRTDQGKLIQRSVTFQAWSGTITLWGLWYSTAVRTEADVLGQHLADEAQGVAGVGHVVDDEHVEPAHVDQVEAGREQTGTSRRLSTPV